MREDVVGAIQNSEWVILHGSFGNTKNIRAANIGKKNGTKIIVDLRDGAFATNNDID